MLLLTVSEYTKVIMYAITYAQNTITSLITVTVLNAPRVTV